jgi:uncharacterized protein
VPNRGAKDAGDAQGVYSAAFMVTTAAQSSAPVAATERMTVLDAVRGVAVLGILVINIDALSGFAFTPPAQLAGLPLANADRVVWFLLSFLVEAKFYSLFSLLFGVGFAVFVQRAAARGVDPARLFKRRLAGLMIIGFVHSLFIWHGDILLTYGVLGFALVPFLRRSDRSVLRWAAAMLLLPIVLYAVLFAAVGQPAPEQSSGSTSGLPPFLAAAAQQLAHGGYLDIVQAHVAFASANVVRRLLLMFFPRVLGMFLLGFYAGRRNLFANLAAHDSLIRTVAITGLAVGLPFSLAATWWGSFVVGPPNVNGLIETIIRSIGVPALALGYAAGLCLLFRRLPDLMRAFAPVGRMALTSYLTHSVAGLIVFTGIGFGLFGRVSLTMAVIGAVAFFIVQKAVSSWWLSRAQFGPAEWLWRMFTYRRRFDLMKSTSA